MSNMKKNTPLVAGFVLFAVVACSQSSPVTDNSTPTATTAKANSTSPIASPTATPLPKPSDKLSLTPKPEEKTNTDNLVDWQDYKSSAGRFSVSVPGKPQEQSQDQSTDVGTIKLNMIIAEANDSAYFVGYADFPNKVNPQDVQKGLANSVKGSVANLKGEIRSEQESALGDIPCRDFEAVGKVKVTDVSMKGKFCLADNRMYQLFALGAKDRVSTTDIDRFITSFKIDK